MRRLDPLHPFFFACFVPLALFARNSNEVGLDQLVTPIVLVVMATLCIQTVLWLLECDLPRFRVLLSMSWLGFFFYAPIHNLGLHHYYLVAVGIIGSGILAVAMRRLSNESVQVVTKALVIVSLLLTANPLRVLLATLVADLSLDYAAFADAAKGQDRHPRRPDIYYLILDGYAGQRTLLDVFKFDNRPFLSTLKAKGFYVGAESQSNYSTTLFSVPSTLNLDYLESMEATQGRRFDVRELKELAMNGRVVSALKGIGYRFVYIDTSTHLRPVKKDFVDEYREYAPVSQFATALYSLTPFRYFPTRYVPLATRLMPPVDQDGKPWVPDSNMWAFDQVRRVSDETGPKFVFAHILSPHSPYYHDPACTVVERYRRQPWNNFNAEFKVYGAAYLGQLECLNKQVTSLLDELILGDRLSQIVVVQADHGPPEILDGSLLRYDSSIDLDAFRFGILNALYVPEHIERQLHPSISPVNTFRLILSYVLGREYGLLPDKIVRRQP